MATVPYVARHGPSRFVFELIDDPPARQARYRELIRQHGPVSNTKQLNQALIHRITQARTVTKDCSADQRKISLIAAYVLESKNSRAQPIKATRVFDGRRVSMDFARFVSLIGVLSGENFVTGSPTIPNQIILLVLT